ncbi:MAG: PKD domain-containing protein [Lentimicrobium sp.]
MSYSNIRYRNTAYRQYKITCHIVVLLVFLLCVQGVCRAEGTRQLEPTGAPSNSLCKLTLAIDDENSRIPFALVDCSEQYRLNIRISNFANEKIYLGFGYVTDYGIDPEITDDVNFQIKDPSGNIVPGYQLRPVPNTPFTDGFIETRAEALSGPDINNTNPGGYDPLVLDPTMNGDYVLEFDFENAYQGISRLFRYFDVTVANGNTPISGRLWSKAWQLSSGSVSSAESASHGSFYIYSNDSIVTSFDCNGLAGGVWIIYSNEWGCSTTGAWSNRRRSVVGNATVPPQYKIFLNDPDPAVFPTGTIGEMISATALPHVCDTAITFAATVSKGGNIEILIDVPPLNSNAFGPEDVQLGYSVTAGYNVLMPPWDGKNAYGVPLANGTVIEARINFLNGLTNIPLHDVEDNPHGFKVDILRPIPGSGNPRLKIFWDDTGLPPFCNPTANVLDGCVYTGTGTVSGCHDWRYDESDLGEYNTVNSWWYYSSDDQLMIPITLELLPRKGIITGPANICAGQLATFRTTSIPFAPRYIWSLTGPGTYVEVEQNAPDTTFTYQFTMGMPQGQYTLSVYGFNPECGGGDLAYMNTVLFDENPPPVAGTASTCVLATSQYNIEGLFSEIQWTVNKGDIVGPAGDNQVTVRWHSIGADTIRVFTTTVDCGIRLSDFPVVVNPVAGVGFSVSGEAISCPGLPLLFTDNSSLVSGAITARNWIWDDGFSEVAAGSEIAHSFAETGNFNVVLEVTTDQGCRSEVTNPIQVIANPVASFSSYSNCISQPIELNDISAGINLVSWTWDFGDAPVTAGNLNLRQPSAVFHQPGMFPVTLVVGNQYGCLDTAVQQVQIHHPPVAAFDHEFPCQGSGILFSDQSIPADASLVQRIWNTKSSSSVERLFQGNPVSIVFDEAIDYEVKLSVTDAFGCIGTVNSIIAIVPKPAGAFNYLDMAGDEQGVLYFKNHTTGAVDYYWDFGNNITSSLFEPETRYSLEGVYTIVLVSYSPEGCADTTSGQYQYLPQLWMPDAFTPDNNGLNDVFKPVTQRNTLEPYLLHVYNRWGQLIFSSTDPGRGWDGSYNGKPCSTGVYSYMLQYREGVEGSTRTITQKGSVKLLD